ncbi:hypothetical protein, partial [Dickeya dianthicola]|uniref:hypothetical protein n=1 Tax=Dickeya dianthicola TaxID=204039 RepID=UPI00055511E7
SLEQSLKVKLNPTLLFGKYATVGTLAEYLLERYPESFRSFAGMAPDVATVTERDNAHQASGTLPDSGISAGINQADAELINA